MYDNNRTNSYVRDGVLYIKPTLMYDHIGERMINGGSEDYWGADGPTKCTSNRNEGCMRTSNGERIINPIKSAKLNSRSFTMKYGKVEIKARLPKGDWIWPGITFTI
jgi:beta-glucanase (GH16 family)